MIHMFEKVFKVLHFHNDKYLAIIEISFHACVCCSCKKKKLARLQVTAE